MSRVILILVVLSLAGVLFCYVFWSGDTPQPPDDSVGQPDAKSQTFGNLTLSWGNIPPRTQSLLVPTGDTDNIHPDSYAGPESCKSCHQKNYDQWRGHAHRRMNALADEENVEGDFSGDATIHYRGGIGTFYREDDDYRMRYERDGVVRVYDVNQTIGSRFYQYYIGKGLEGPEPKEHGYYHEDHVLPFGYWLDRKAWVPIVHISTEHAEGKRWEQVDSHKPPDAGDDEGAPGEARGVSSRSGDMFLKYASACNFCHTTFPLGDMFARMPEVVASNLPAESVFSFSDYLADSRPELWDGSRDPSSYSDDEFNTLLRTMGSLDASQHAVTLGVSCEACHLGAKAHAKKKRVKPSFAPHSPYLSTIKNRSDGFEKGRTHENLNWICSRCHNGDRPTYAAGMSTWNSTEFTDASRGSCYTKLNCIDCHDPHQTIGKKWSKPPEHDDLSCLKCHDNFREPKARLNHTHHPAGSSGDRCMNCHMPKINEGMQDVVRTHMIFSPTRAEMIEAGDPNACNLCHLDKPIDWTLEKLNEWYDKQYSFAKVNENYPLRNEAVALNWLKNDEQGVRISTIEALCLQNERWAIGEVVEALDDEYLMVRQFAHSNLEKMLDVKLDEKFGYWFYMMKDERQEPVAKIREWANTLEGQAEPTDE